MMDSLSLSLLMDGWFYSILLWYSSTNIWSTMVGVFHYNTTHNKDIFFGTDGCPTE